MRPRLVVAILLVAVVSYVGILSAMAWAFISAGGLGSLLGVGLLMALGASVWAVTREVRFGVESTRLARILSEQDGVPLDTLERDEQGRVDPAAAEIEWQRRKALADAAPQDWRAWFLLGIAYDNARDRRQARAAIRHAIVLHRQG